MRSRSIPARSLAQEFLVFWSCDELAAGQFRWSKFLLLRLCDDRQNHANRRASLQFAFGLDVTAMELRDVFHDREAETSAADIFGCARFIDAVKALENARQIFFPNADAFVAYAKHNFFIALSSLKSDLAMLIRIFHGVIEQIVESFLQPRDKEIVLSVSDKGIGIGK